ncbi:chitin deacetylase [Gryganskiella cystojenkinii]|nr:chitin deacetylase [Gryganskiella cystojenkinii]
MYGSNVVKLPELVLKEVNAGHHLASYTWSGHALTTLTNEQIVAEIRWTEKAIEQATGYRVRYVRPPYGDVDNRVRYVLKELGYTVVNWSGKAFDSNDSKMPELSGFISVENDISPETVAVAKELIPYGLSKTLKITTVAECLHDTSPYATRTGGV